MKNYVLGTLTGMIVLSLVYYLHVKTDARHYPTYIYAGDTLIIPNGVNGYARLGRKTIIQSNNPGGIRMRTDSLNRYITASQLKDSFYIKCKPDPFTFDTLK